MGKIAIISQHRFVYDDCKNLWRGDGENRVLLSQCEELPGGGDYRAVALVLWSHIASALASLDKVVIYLGHESARIFVPLAAENDLAPEKLIFVYCDCTKAYVEEVIDRDGYSSAQKICCHCSDRLEVMKGIYQNFLADGSLPS